jgi:hypothetical protein
MQILANGVTVASGAASLNTAIPNDSGGNVAKVVRVQCTAFAYIKFGKGTQTASSTSIMISPNCSEDFRTTGCDNFAVIQQSAAGSVNVTPVEC